MTTVSWPMCSAHVSCVQKVWSTISVTTSSHGRGISHQKPIEPGMPHIVYIFILQNKYVILKYFKELHVRAVKWF